jgi:hypothetical protein
MISHEKYEEDRNANILYEKDFVPHIGFCHDHTR